MLPGPQARWIPALPQSQRRGALRASARRAQPDRRRRASVSVQPQDDGPRRRGPRLCRGGVRPGAQPRDGPLPRLARASAGRDQAGRARLAEKCADRAPDVFRPVGQSLFHRPQAMTEPTWAVFDRDAASHSGYLYTATSRLSSRLATQRSTEAILACGRFTGRSVIDIGCGDGFYSNRFWDAAAPKNWVGVDPAENAIQVANANKGARPIRFEVGDAHHLTYPDNNFDLALAQSILHHDSDPRQTLREAFRVAPEVLIHEPNGNNFGLKIIQVASPYHREHGEKSYTTRRMRQWVEAAGGKGADLRFAGVVPLFSPDGLAKPMKRTEPVLEQAPRFRCPACSVYVMVAARS